MSVGERLREARAKKGLSQAALAEAAGVQQSTISRWERGEWTGADELGRLAALLGVSANWLVFGEEDRGAAE